MPVMTRKIQAPLGARRPKGRSIYWNKSETDQMATPNRQQRETSRARLKEEDLRLAFLLEAEPTTPTQE
jgi:hypothetical protein